MALITPTGEFEAIKLEHIRGRDMVRINTEIEELKQKNGGFGQLMIDLKRGVFSLLHVHATFFFGSKDKPPGA